MIARVWRGATRPEDAEAYLRFLAEHLLPGLHSNDGFEGAYVLTNRRDDEVEFVTLTMFASMEAVRSFAGSQPEQPVIEPEAARLLSRIGERVEHLEVVATV